MKLIDESPVNLYQKRNRVDSDSLSSLSKMERLSYTLITMNSKNVKIVIGPCVNVNNLAVKRIKRKSVQLLRRTVK